MSSRERTAYAVNCRYDGLVYLTNEEYNFQLGFPNRTWRCPICREEADWDDENYENYLKILDS